jgi:hypothetical protein
MESLTTSRYSLLYQAESWLARQVGTDLLELRGNHMTYLTEPARVADSLRLLRERSAEPDTPPGINQPPGPASRSSIASTAKADQAFPPGS